SGAVGDEPVEQCHPQERQRPPPPGRQGGGHQHARTEAREGGQEPLHVAADDRMPARPGPKRPVRAQAPTRRKWATMRWAAECLGWQAKRVAVWSGIWSTM